MNILRKVFPARPLGRVFALAIVVVFAAGCARQTVEQLIQQATAAATACHWRDAYEASTTALYRDRNNLTARILQGISLQALRKSEEAIDTLRQAADAAPKDFCAQYFYGWVLCEAGRFGDALAPLKRAYEIRRNHPDLLILLSRCSLEQNLPDGQRYLAGLRGYRTYRDSPEVYNAMAMLWLGQGDYRQARLLFGEALERDPQNPALLQNLAVLHDQYLHEPQPALQYYLRALAASQKVGDRQRESRLRSRLKGLAEERQHVAPRGR